ncbi:unnamed protein product [Linum tenue]|uniref:Uncharacterized protein n=1 Tax=Linum tenue TaxID=586396 RepID=A0AAV0HFP6_9ROSI|nr:unnamed protein product [Linum tenue]CAI0384523.1 unnamed protein product [Linum tenue]
MMRGTMSLACC